MQHYSHACTTPRSVPEGKSDYLTETDTRESDKEETEAFNWQMQSKGLPYESYNELLHANPETVYSIAPLYYRVRMTNSHCRRSVLEEMCKSDSTLTEQVVLQ